jgi:hypothetical protein
MNKGWTAESIAEKLQCEDLCYMVTDYLDPDKISDPELRKLWETAKTALADVVKYIETAIGHGLYDDY